MALLTPTYYLESVFAIDPEGMEACGFDALLLDADNTLLPRTLDEVPPEVIAWVRGMVDAGFELMILSNNWHDRVLNTATAVGLPLVNAAWKPLPFGFMRAQKRLVTPKRKTLVVGDQLFTDVLGAKPLGYAIAKVVPQVKKDLPHTVFLRRFERPLMGDIKPAAKLRPEFRLT